MIDTKQLRILAAQPRSLYLIVRRRKETAT
jgi:hypothetical protein